MRIKLKKRKKMPVTKYNQNTSSVKRQMLSIETFLKEKYGTIQPQWECGLLQIADTLETINTCKAEIQKDGLVISTPHGTKKSPAFMIQKESQILLISLLKEYRTNTKKP